MEVYKNGRTAYVAIPRNMSRKDAITKANEYLKVKVEDLEIGIGHIKDDTLTIRRRGGNVWVISRREKA